MNALSGKKVFVTGATGLLGGTLARQLVDCGCEVTILVRDRVPSSAIWKFCASDGTRLHEKLSLVHGDVTDLQLLVRALNEGEIECVFHLAAQTIVEIATTNPLSTFESNIRGTYLILEACRTLKDKIRAVVIASSDKAYGISELLPYDETTALRGIFPYDVSKSCADLLAQSYYHSFGLPICVTRCSNLYGPGDLNENRLIPGTICSALRGERPIVRSDGSLVRDYLYVEDGALGYRLIANRLMEDPNGVAGEAFNFSTEDPKSVLQVVQAILELTGRSDLEPDLRRTSRNEILEQTLNAAKAKRVLRWSPRFLFEDSLVKTIEWYAAAQKGRTEI